MRYGVMAVLLLIVLSSGCVQGGNGNLGNETTSYEYRNLTANQSVHIPRGDFTFNIAGDNEFWIPPNGSVRYSVAFNNVDEDEARHKFVARVHPSAADFDVMAGYSCLHFKTCSLLLEDMESFIIQPETQVDVNYSFVGIQTFEIKVPAYAVNGTYLFNMVACQDIPFENCTETKANWGPNIPIIVHVL